MQLIYFVITMSFWDENMTLEVILDVKKNHFLLVVEYKYHFKLHALCSNPTLFCQCCSEHTYSLLCFYVSFKHTVYLRRSSNPSAMFCLGNVSQKFSTSEKWTYLPLNSLVTLFSFSSFLPPPLSVPSRDGSPNHQFCNLPHGPEYRVLPWPSPLLPSPAIVPLEQLGNLPPWGWQFTVKTHATHLPTRRPWWRLCRAHGPRAGCPTLCNDLLVQGRAGGRDVVGGRAVYMYASVFIIWTHVQ